MEQNQIAMTGETYPLLFSPMKIGNVEIKNRVVMMPMGVDQCDPDGRMTDRAIEYYRERAKGGVGLIIVEYTRINESDGVSSVGQPSLADDSYIPGMRKLVDAIHAEGAKVFIQIQHPGRQSIPLFPTIWPALEKFGRIPGFWDTYSKAVQKATAGGFQGLDGKTMKRMQIPMKPLLAPSRLPDDPTISLWYVKHRAMTKKDIKRVEQQFVDAAVRVKKAGADGVEIHATHGYLLQQFLSPFTNRRTDEYGGSFENRARIVKEIIEGIRTACGVDFPLSIRLTIDECEDKVGHPERGYHMDEGVRFAKYFADCGVDDINVSCASTDALSVVTESMRYPLGWRKVMSKAVKEVVDIPVIAAGLIRTPEQAEAQLEEGDQDFIGLARSLLADPNWVKKAQERRSKEISRCICCNRCMECNDENMMVNNVVECSLNPRLCYEGTIPEEPKRDGSRRPVIVVGAGPSGLLAARELAKRDFDVTVYEKGSGLGGEIDLASRPPHKERILWTTEDYLAQAKAAGAKIVFNKQIAAEDILELNPYAVFVATGGYAVHPRIPGADADYVCTVTPVLLGETAPENQDVAVIGSGMTGLETAEKLMENGNRVTIVEMAKTICPGANAVATQEILPLLSRYGAVFLPGHKLEKIENHEIVLSDKKGTEKRIHADYVVLSLGVRSENTLYNELKGKLDHLYVIGDAKKAGRIVNATHAAFQAARDLS